MTTRYETEAMKFLQNAGWKVYQNGLPDFLCTNGNTLLFVEVKAGNSKLSNNQESTLKILKEYHHTVALVRVNLKKEKQGKTKTVFRCPNCGASYGQYERPPRRKKCRVCFKALSETNPKQIEDISITYL